MIRLLWLRYMLHCLRTQERGLLMEQRGIEALISRNAEDQRRVSAQLTMCEIERSYRVVK